jgi:hypothetical protein
MSPKEASSPRDLVRSVSIKPFLGDGADMRDCDMRRTDGTRTAAEAWLQSREHHDEHAPLGPGSRGDGLHIQT